jgi:hypothetical protein
VSAHEEPLRERNWDQILKPLFTSTAPDRHVVLDAALRPASFEILRSDLLSSWSWHYRSQPGYVLCHNPSESAIVRCIAGLIGEQLSHFLPDLEAREEWAFLHQRPFEEFIHTDVGAYVWTLWLTPEQWDQSPETSGLRLYPLARPEDVPNSREHTLRYLEANPVQSRSYVRYRENRAVMFPASTFHAIGPCHFDASETAKMRCSVTIIFDEHNHWVLQHSSQT